MPPHLLLAAALLVCCPSAATASDIWAVGTGGGGRTVLTGGDGGWKQNLDVSPDGSKITYDDGYSIWVMNADGSGAYVLVEFDGDVLNVAPMFTGPSTISFSRYGPDTREIARINTDGSGYTHLTDVPSTDGGFAFSPDGSKVAFARSGPGVSTIWVMDSDGSNEALVATGGGQGNYSPTFSPDGERIAFVQISADADIWIMNSDGSAAAPLTQDGLGGPTDAQPSFSPGGGSIAYVHSALNESDNTGIYSMSADGTGQSQVVPAVGSNNSPAYLSSSVIVFSGPDLKDYLLQRFIPELRYDALETYRADLASEITDNYVNDGGETVRSNYLNDEGGNHIAASDPALPEDQLGLGYLGAEYWPEDGTGPYPAESTDRIDEANEYEEDAQRLHADPAYANQVHGRVVPDVLTGGWTLQYWLFYYYNPKTYFTFGAHEGDWELAQVHVSSDMEPLYATYAQHGWGEKCPWANVQTTGGHPIVYVAEGSHASYFSSGYHANPAPGEPWKLADDTANGDGDVLTPTVSDVSGSGWLDWPGRWGGSGSSPEGPAHQGLKWGDPAAWSEGVKECSEEQLAGALKNDNRGVAQPTHPAGVPPAPIWSVRRQGDTAVFRYRFKRMPKGLRRHPWILLTSIDSRGMRYSPLTVRTRIRHRSGVVRQRVGLGSGPFRARLGVLAKSGTRSQTITKRLTGR